MPKASDIKKGMVVRVKDQPCVVHHIDIRTPSSRGSNTLYKFRLYNVQTRQKLDESFKGEDMLDPVDMVRRKAEFSYMDGADFVFMDTEDYTPYTLSPDDLGEQAAFVSEGLGEVMVMLIEDKPGGIELPASVVIEVSETAPAIKGGTVTKRTKPATLANGLEIQVPEYLAPGEMVKVNTETLEFMGRA